MLSDPRVWSEQVWGDSDLGDERLNRRLVDVGARLAAHPSGSIPVVCGGDDAAQEGMYRFMSNERSKGATIREAGFGRAIALARDCEVILSVDDTTAISAAHPSAESWGPLGGPHNSGRGWFVHSNLLLDGKDGRTLGLAGQDWWMREPGGKGTRSRRKKVPYEQKESFKWEAAQDRLSERLGEQMMKRVVTVADREADIYEFLDHQFEKDRRFVVRAAYNRKLSESDQGLWGWMAEAPILGEKLVEVRQKSGRKARVARVELRAARVRLRPPQRRDGTGSRLGPVDLWAVAVQEVDPPADAEPLHWMLLTTEAAPDLESAWWVVQAYTWRWRVEDYHKAWKSGCRVELRRMQNPGPFECLGSILAFVAVRLVQCRELGLASPEEPCTAALEEQEWRCLWLSEGNEQKDKPMPKKPPTMGWAYRAMARLGGWHDSKRTGRAGWDAMWFGWFRLRERLVGWQLAQAIPKM